MQLIIEYCIKYLQNHLLKHNRTKENCVKQSKLILIIGVVCVLFFGTILGLIIWNNPLNSFYYMSVLGLFVCLGLFLVLYSVFYRIDYNDEGFTYRKLFKRRKTYKYESVTSISYLDFDRKTIIYVGDETVSVDMDAIGSQQFIKQVKSGYAETHNEQTIPSKPYRKKDIFNGNLLINPNVYLAVGITVFLFLVILSIFVIRFTTPKNYDALEIHTVTLDTIEHDNNSLILNSTTYKYRINNLNSITNYDKLVASIENRETFTLRVSRRNSKAYLIEEMTDSQNNEFVSYKASLKHNRRNCKIAICFSIVLTSIWVVYFVFSIYIARNPKKFNKKFVDLFFRQGTIKY